MKNRSVKRCLLYTLCVMVMVTGCGVWSGVWHFNLRQRKHVIVSDHLRHQHRGLIDNSFTNFKTRSLQVRTAELNKPEVRHIMFLKVHKSASTTVLNILYRFGASRNLTFVLPKGNNYIAHHDGVAKIYPPPKNKTFDLVCNHVIFSAELFADLLPADTVYIAIVREPLQRLYSAFVYFRDLVPTPYLTRVRPARRGASSRDAFTTYLQDPRRYEPANPRESRTNNRMAVDMGFPPADFHSEDAFGRYLHALETRFDLVMVKELFDESLVLMRRLLHWKVKDVLYVAHNTNNQSDYTHIDTQTAARVKSFLRFDYLIYEHFHNRVTRAIEQQGDDFKAEVTYFKTIQAKLKNFCMGELGTKDDGYVNIHSVTFSASKWNHEFKIDRRECARITLHEIKFLDEIRQSHIALLKRVGANNNFVKSLKHRLTRLT